MHLCTELTYLCDGLDIGREDTASPVTPLPDSLVTATATSVSTKCCYQITQPSLPTSLYELRTSAVLTASAPALGVGVNVTRMYCAGASSAAMCTTKLVNSSVCVADATGLLLRPRTSFYAFTTSTSATFALYASKGGCTRLFTHSFLRSQSVGLPDSDVVLQVAASCCSTV